MTNTWGEGGREGGREGGKEEGGEERKEVKEGGRGARGMHQLKYLLPIASKDVHAIVVHYCWLAESFDGDLCTLYW